MRKKLISKTYLRDVNKYNLHIYLDNDDYYLCVKKIINIEKPFLLSSGDCLIDNNYYIIELLPKTENYSMRIFFNENKKRLLYYFDITLSNGIDEETQIPYYDDLYLDIVVKDNEKIKVLDENELQEALNKNVISESQFKLANYTKDFLINDIKNKKNKYMNLDLEKYLMY